MKSIFALVILLASFNASATVIKSPCNPMSYHYLNEALNTAAARTGSEFRATLQGILAEEMGPRCETVIDTNRMVGIPGRKNVNYEITSTSGSFDITVVDDMESHQVFLFITKAKRRY